MRQTSVGDGNDKGVARAPLAEVGSVSLLAPRYTQSKGTYSLPSWPSLAPTLTCGPSTLASPWAPWPWARPGPSTQSNSWDNSSRRFTLSPNP